jgi:hypothetical protein
MAEAAGWTMAETTERQRWAGQEMTPAERLDWLEEVLDELLPLLGRARALPASSGPATLPKAER